ncbi:MAG: formate dehydrogenase accessory sulfurtransferase FdhD, partial [Myxococcales bacterium]|nr:formate dehydrogenase accessory sulfurtransferase FdhD [Myxococcales bacterium]
GSDSYTIMRTPGADLDLAVGFLLAEAIIDGIDDVVQLTANCEFGNTVQVKLRSPPPAGSAAGEGSGRNLAVASSCGLCGRAGVEKLIEALPVVREGIQLPVSVLFEVPARLRAAQRVFQRTGGSHAAALFDARGELVVVGEDLGRHSALDKALGRALRQGIAMDNLGAIISGRTSLEMIVKAARAGIGLLVAVSAPSSAAVECAERLGITLCGFARGDELSVYCNPQSLSDG